MKDSKSKRTRTPTPEAGGEDSREQAPSPTRVKVYEPQVAPCPFAVAGDRVAYLGETRLAVHHGPDWKLELGEDVDSPHGIGVLAGGALATLEGLGQTTVRTLAAGAAATQRFTGLVTVATRRRSRLFAGKAADQLTVATRGKKTTLERVTLKSGEIESGDDLTLSAEAFDTLTSLGDDSLVYAESAGLVRVAFGQDAKTHRAESAGWIRQLAAGPRPDTVWASDNAGGLHLLSVADPVKVLARADVAVYHLASAGERVAALEVEQDAGKVTALTLVALDAKAAELWRRPLPLPEGPHFPPHWVAASERFVAAGSDEKVAVFAAADGKPLGGFDPPS